MPHNDGDKVTPGIMLELEDVRPLLWDSYRERALDRFSLRWIGRRVTHVSPRYLLDLAAVRAFEILQPDAPWLTRTAVRILESALMPQHRGLEYGSGRSTVWLARKTA